MRLRCKTEPNHVTIAFPCGGQAPVWRAEDSPPDTVLSASCRQNSLSNWSGAVSAARRQTMGSPSLG